MKSELIGKTIRDHKKNIDWLVTNVTNHNHGFYIRIFHCICNNLVRAQFSENHLNRLIKAGELEVIL